MMEETDTQIRSDQIESQYTFTSDEIWAASGRLVVKMMFLSTSCVEFHQTMLGILIRTDQLILELARRGLIKRV